MPKLDVIVLIDDNHLEDFSKVVKLAEEKGLKITQQMQEIGILTGSIDKKDLESIEKIKGVANIEISKKFQIAPPDEDIQ